MKVNSPKNKNRKQQAHPKLHKCIVNYYTAQSKLYCLLLRVTLKSQGHNLALSSIL